VIARALTIAGSDSGGGAGIQADLKTFQELDVFGMSAITALTAQNTCGVQGVFPQSLEAIEAQIDSVLSDIGADAVKTGMLFSADIIELVSNKLKQYEVKNIVVDPVMIAKGGAELLQEQAVEALKKHLIPHATIITPNLPEASKLLGGARITNVEEMITAARDIHQLGCQYVVIKGGHLETGEAVDVLFDGEEATLVTVERVSSKHTHGTGCTFASAIAAGLAKGQDVKAALKTAKQFITAGIEEGLPIGSGIGPTKHSAFRHKQQK
jgi:hydroxymethylpyrimidine/phosphomethylpyrimidine kinase